MSLSFEVQHTETENLRATPHLCLTLLPTDKNHPPKQGFLSLRETHTPD